MFKYHLYFFLLLSLSLIPVYGQVKANIGIGYGAGTHLRAGGLDYVIDRYNETRSYLSRKMNHPGFFQGVNLAIDYYFPKSIMDIEIVQRKSDMTAEAGSLKQSRDLRYKVNSFNLGYGAKLNTKNSKVTGSYLGLDFSLIIVKNYTRTYQTGGNKSDFTRISWEPVIGFSPYLQLVGNRFTAKIYYQYTLTKQDFWDVNVRINPNTWSKDNISDVKGRTSSIGISTRYNLINNKK